MKKSLNLLHVVLCLILAPFFSLAQAHYQPCHGQDTSTQYRVKLANPIAIAISGGEQVAVAAHNKTTYGSTGTVKVWTNLTRFMMGLNPNDSIHLTGPEGVAYDRAGNLYAVQTERADSNIMIYNSALHLIKVIDNSPGTALSWFTPRGIALDSAQNLYIVGGDSVTTAGVSVAHTGKLIKIANPLSTATKSVLVTGLDRPKAVAIRDNDLYLSEYDHNMISRYNLHTMVKVDSASINKPFDLYSTGCRLYCTVHDSNRVKILDAQNLAGGIISEFSSFDTGTGPLGITLDDDVDLLVCDSNRVYYYSDSESVTDTDFIAGSATGGRMVYIYCLGHNETLTDSSSLGRWYTHDTTGIFIHTDATDRGMVHIIGKVPGTYRVYNTHGSITDSFSVTIAAGDVFHPVTITDSVRGGTWFTADTAVIALAPTYFDSVINFYGYQLGGGLVFYRHGSTIDTFFVNVDSLPAPAGPIYTYGNSGYIYGSYRFCIGTICQLLDDSYGGGSYWSISDESIAIIDEADGVVWPQRAGTAIVTYTYVSACGSTQAYFTVIIDSNASSGSITGASAFCRGNTLVLKNAILGGVWQADTTGILSISGAAGDSITVTGTYRGTGYVRYYIDNTCADTQYHSVQVNTAPASVSISGSSGICLGASTLLTADGADSTATGYWASSASYYVSTFGSTDSTTIIFGTGIGYAIITYTESNSCGTASASIYVSVFDPYIDAGTISGPSVICGPGSTFTETVSYGYWESSDPGIADISPYGGVVTPHRPGSITIFYTVTGFCAYAVTSVSVVILDSPYAGAITGPSTVCQSAAISFTDTATGGSWYLSNGHATLSGTSATGVSAGVDTVVYTVSNACGTVYARQAFTVVASVTPAVTIAAFPSDSLCSGDTVTFTPTPVNGGASPLFIWERFGIIVDTGVSFTYVPVLGDFIKCIMVSHAVCAIPDSVTSPSLEMAVVPTVTPTDTISCASGDTVRYLGQIVTLNSELSYCGAPATYQWYLNGNPVAGATTMTWASAVYSNDTIYCVNTCNTPCATRLTDTSNTIVLYADYLRLGIRSIQQSSGNYTLMPNPNNGYFTLSGTLGSNAPDNLHYDVLDLTGKVLLTGNTQPQNSTFSQQIDLDKNNIASGQYIIRIVTGSDVAFVHFVLER